MSLDEERLAAYVDGELGPEERAAVERELTADPTAAAWVAEQRALRAALGDAFDPTLREPVPERLLAMTREHVAPSAGVVDLGTAREGRAPRRPRTWALAEWSAIAASFVVGAVAVFAFRGAGHDLPVASRDGTLVAQGALAEALATQASGADGAVRVAFTFRSQEGEICRAFSAPARGGAVAGFACRTSDAWRVDVLAPAGSGASGDFAQASSALPSGVLAAIDARIVGEPLESQDESAARDRGWRMR